MKIDGELIGFGDFYSDEVGVMIARPPAGKAQAASQSKGAVVKAAQAAKPAGKGKDTYPKGKKSTVMTQHGKVLQKAKGTLFNTARKLGAAQVSLARKPAAVKLTTGKKIVGPVHVGAAVAKAMTAKQKAAVAKHNAAVVKAKNAAKVLAQHAIKAKGSVKELAKKAVEQKKKSKWVRTPPSKRGAHIGMLLNDPEVGEEVAELLGEYYDAIGAMPDPSAPGYLDDGSLDPAYWDLNTGQPLQPMGAPSTSGPQPGSFGSPTSMPPQDLGLPTDDLSLLSGDDPADSGMPMPDPLPMNSYIADMQAVGGIAYDDSKGTPDGYIVSYGMATKSPDHPGRTTDGTAQGVRWEDAHWVYPIDWMNHYGYVWGKYDPPKGGFDGGEDLTAGAWNEFHGGKGRGDWFTPNVPASDALASFRKSAPNGVQYGPLVGNPSMPDFARMRVDGQGNRFWLPQEAPDWLMFPIKQAAALTDKAEREAAAAQKKLDDAANAKAAADAAAAQAAQDAANALAESADASTQRIAQQAEVTAQAQQVTQQAAAETAAQQALVVQQQQDTAEQQYELEQTKQITPILLQRAQMEQEFLQQHPEVYAEQYMQAMESGGDEEGGGEEEPISSDVMESGEQIPGGDVMRDSDGEGYVEEEE